MILATGAIIPVLAVLAIMPAPPILMIPALVLMVPTAVVMILVIVLPLIFLTHGPGYRRNGGTHQKRTADRPQHPWLFHE